MFFELSQSFKCRVGPCDLTVRQQRRKTFCNSSSSVKIGTNTSVSPTSYLCHVCVTTVLSFPHSNKTLKRLFILDILSGVTVFLCVEKSLMAIVYFLKRNFRLNSLTFCKLDNIIVRIRHLCRTITTFSCHKFL
jgi:hypothetical protein